MLFGEKDANAPAIIASKNRVRTDIKNTIEGFFRDACVNLNWPDEVLPSVSVKKMHWKDMLTDSNFGVDFWDMGEEGEPAKDYTEIVINVGTLDFGERHDYLADSVISLMKQAQRALANGRIVEDVDTSLHGTPCGNMSAMQGISKLKIEDSDGGLRCNLRIDSDYMNNIAKAFGSAAKNVLSEGLTSESTEVAGRSNSKTVLFA